MLSSKDLNFVGYTYKNFELVNDHDVPGMGTVLISSLCAYMSMNLGDKSQKRLAVQTLRHGRGEEKKGSSRITKSS